MPFDPSVAEIVYSESSTCSGCVAEMEKDGLAMVFTAWVNGKQEPLIFCEACIEGFIDVLSELTDEEDDDESPASDSDN
jgi:hypothetical protein